MMGGAAADRDAVAPRQSPFHARGSRNTRLHHELCDDTIGAKVSRDTLEASHAAP